jgi:GTP-binding protein HflX
VERDEYDKIRRVFLSAQTGEGVDLLREAIAEFATKERASQPGEEQSVDDDDMRFTAPDQHTN